MVLFMNSKTKIDPVEYVTEDGIMRQIPYQGVKKYFVLSLNEEGVETGRAYFATPGKAFEFGKLYFSRFRTGEK